MEHTGPEAASVNQQRKINILLLQVPHTISLSQAAADVYLLNGALRVTKRGERTPLGLLKGDLMKPNKARTTSALLEAQC